MTASNKDLFSFGNIVHEEAYVSATININANSEILKGHFPGHPVVPGACMLQLIKDVLETALTYRIRLRKAAQLKFMNMIDPTISPTIQLDISYEDIEEESIKVTAKLFNAEVTYFKFLGIFTRE